MRVLLSGYYGFGNIGDEALLEVIVSQIRSRFPGVEVEVLSAKPTDTAKQFSVVGTDRWNTREVRGAIERADVVLSGGGGLLQNATSLRSLLYYVGIIHQAARAKRKVMIFAQSIGPLDVFGRFIVREGCKSISGATVRDARSKELLASLLPKISIEQTADPVFLYDNGNEVKVDLSHEGLGPESTPYAIVSVRKIPGFEQGAGAIARAVDRLRERHNIHVAFLPLGGASDAEVSTAIIRKCTTSPLLLPESSLERTAEIVRGAHVMIGMRLHALIFAAKYGVPFLSIPYDPKVRSLCADLEYPLDPLWTPGQAVPDAAQVDTMVDEFVEQREILAKHLRECIATVQAAAARNFDVLGEILRAH
jgi:polysaccharide pyruvyl transferase CsaB